MQESGFVAAKSAAASILEVDSAPAGVGSQRDYNMHRRGSCFQEGSQTRRGRQISIDVVKCRDLKQQSFSRPDFVSNLVRAVRRSALGA